MITIDEGTEPMRFAAGRSRTRFGWRMLFVALAGLLAVPACGGDDESPDEGEATSTTEAEPDSTTTTQPPGTDPAAVTPIVEDLLVRLDEVTTEILADPAAALDDPDGAAIAELEAIFAAGDPFDARLSAYQRNASQGLTIEPLDTDTVTTTVLSGDLSTVDDEIVEGPLCILNTYRSASTSGGESQDRLAHPGQVTAVRLDGVWKIQRVDVDDTQSCEPEASA